MSYTKGPWIVGNNGVDIHTADSAFNEIATAMDKKDAKLIAAAPELLEACYGVVAALNKKDEDLGSDLYQTIFQMEKAIAKATT